jgi:hypothetical protein
MKKEIINLKTFFAKRVIEGKLWVWGLGLGIGDGMVPGARYLTGENLKVVRAKFSTLS